MDGWQALVRAGWRAGRRRGLTLGSAASAALAQGARGPSRLRRAVVASHHTALVLHDLPAFAADLRQVHVMRIDDGQFRRRPGLTVHERVPGMTDRNAAVDVSRAITGTGRVNGQMAALIAADAALHRQMLTREELTAAATDLVGAGSAVARRVAELADARVESPGETRL